MVQRLHALLQLLALTQAPWKQEANCLSSATTCLSSVASSVRLGFGAEAIAAPRATHPSRSVWASRGRGGSSVAGIRAGGATTRALSHTNKNSTHEHIVRVRASYDHAHRLLVLQLQHPPSVTAHLRARVGTNGEGTHGGRPHAQTNDQTVAKPAIEAITISI
jgi:hypothetical protein